jgi:hypothetical protein
MFYVNMVYSEDVETQRKGMIGILYNVGQGGAELDKESSWKLTLLLKACPVRLEATHFCSDTMSLWFMTLIAIFKIGSALGTRLRIRTHCGKC